MNVQDSNVVRSILKSADYKEVDEIENADTAIANTCSIRENAESKVCDNCLMTCISPVCLLYILGIRQCRGCSTLLRIAEPAGRVLY